MAEASPLERDGVVRDAQTGEAFIPASRRSDGTWRKPRKVKEGYVPQEEMPVYENKGVQMLKSRSSLPPGLNIEETPKPSDASSMSKAAKKNAKRKEKKRQQQGDSAEKTAEALAKISFEKQLNKAVDSNKVNTDPKAEAAKKIKNLNKKLRQIEDLEAKVKSGELKPATEQVAKIAKKKSILDEIADLEAELED